MVFFSEIIVVGINLLFVPKDECVVHPDSSKWTRRVIILFGSIIIVFTVATFVEEGFHLVLPENPTNNRLFEDLGLSGSSSNSSQ